MTVSSQTNRKEATGDGATVEFDFPYRFLLGSDLKVYVAGSLVSSNDYTVAGAGDPGGGTVTFDTAPANAAKVVIINSPPLTQAVDYDANDDFPSEAHEGALDKATLVAQFLSMRMARAVRFADGVVTTFDPTIPTDFAAGDLLRAKDDGTGWEAVAFADISSLAGLSDEIAALGAITTEIVGVYGNAANVTTVAGISANVSTVAGISAAIALVAAVDGEVVTVAGIASDVSTVAGVASSVSALGPISAAISAAAAIDTDISAVAAIASDISTLAPIAADITTVADLGIVGILSGSGAPAGGLGVNGNFYIDTAAWDIYGPKTAGAWGSATSLIGPAGPGTGDVSGPSGGVVDNEVALYDSTTGKLIKGSSILSTALATLTGSQTLTNKTIDLASNTLTGSLAQFNTALSGADFASLAGAETLTNKTITSPAISGPTLSGTVAGTPTVSGSWDWAAAQTITAGFPQLTLRDNATAATDKYGMIRGAQYDSATETEGFVAIATGASSSNNGLYLGGGFSAHNASTFIAFVCAANTTTRTGTNVAQLTTSAFTINVPIAGGGAVFTGSASTDGLVQIMASTGSDLIWAVYDDSPIGSATRAISYNRGTNEVVVGPAATGGLQARVAASSETTGTLTSASANRKVTCSGGVTLPNSVFTTNDFTLFDPGTSNRTFTRGSGISMYVNGTDVASATLAANQMGTAHWRSSSVAVLNGGFT